MLANRSIHDFCALLESDSAVGTGSALALTALNGVGVLRKTLEIAARKSVIAAPAAREKLSECAAALEGLMDADAAALAAALPRLLASTPDGSAKEWNDALEIAIAPPLAMMEKTVEALETAAAILPELPAYLRCDVQAAALLCRAACGGGALLAGLNAGLLRDAAGLAAEYRRRIESLAAAAEALLDRILD